jgi:hypothetical protein
MAIKRQIRLTTGYSKLSGLGYEMDSFCGLVVRVPGHRAEMYCVSCAVQTEKKVDRLCGLVVRVPGYTTEMYCASCEVRTELIYVM